MIIDPRTAIQEGWISGIKNQERQVQPNAIDFTLDRLFQMSVNDFIISVDPETNEEIKQMRGAEEITPCPHRSSNIDFFHLQGKTSYDCMSDVFVTIPEGVAALLIVRSTYNRNGLFITSGIYDSGFSNNLGFVLHNLAIGAAKIQKGICVGQILFVEAGTSHLYSGEYNKNPGKHYSDVTGKHFTEAEGNIQ